MALTRRGWRQSVTSLPNPSGTALDIPMTPPPSFKQWANHGAAPQLSTVLRKDAFTMQTYEYFQRVCKSTWTSNMENGISLIVFLGDCLIDISDPKTAEIKVVLTGNHERHIELRGAFATHMSLPQAVNTCRMKCETAFGVLEQSMRKISSAANDLHMSLGPLGKLAQSTQKNSNDASINKQWHAKEVCNLIDAQIKERQNILSQWIDLGDHVSNLHDVLIEQLGLFHSEERRLEREINAGRNKTESLEQRMNALRQAQSTIEKDLSSQKNLRKEILGQRTHLRTLQADTAETLEEERANLRRGELGEIDEQSRFSIAEQEDQARRNNASMFSKLFGSDYSRTTSEHKQRTLERNVRHQKNLDDQLAARSKIRSLEQRLAAVQRKLQRNADPATRERENELKIEIEELMKELEGSEAKIAKEQEVLDKAEAILMNNQQMLDYVVSYKKLVPDLCSHLASLVTYIKLVMASLDEFLTAIPDEVKRLDKFLTGMGFEEETGTFAPMNRSQGDIRESVEDATMSRLKFGIIHHMATRWEETCNQMYQKALTNIAPMGSISSAAAEPVFADYQSQSSSTYLSQSSSRSTRSQAPNLLASAFDTVHVDGMSRDERRQFLWAGQSLAITAIKGSQDTERVHLIECLNKSYQDVMVSPEVVNVAKQRSESWFKQLSRRPSRRQRGVELPAHDDLLG